MIRELPWLGVGEEPHSKLYTSGNSAPATGPGVFRESARGQAARVLRGRGARSGARAPRLPAPGGPASGAGQGGSRLGSPRPADPTALPLLAAAPACRARPPPCRARSSSRFRISTTCSRMAAAATASRASPATRSPPGSTWATRESLLWSPSPAGPSRDAPPTRELGRGRQPAQVGGVGAWSLLQSSSRDWAGAGRGLQSPPTPARGVEEPILVPSQRGPSLLGVHRAPGSARPAPRPSPARDSALGQGRDCHVHLTGGSLSPGGSPARVSCDGCLVLQ